MKNSSKNGPLRKYADKRSSREKPEAAGLLPLVKDLNQLQARAEKKGYEFLSYLLHMAILEAQSLASAGGGELGGSSRDQGGPSSDGG